MRIGMLAAAVALLGAGCYTESAPSRYYVARDREHPAEFDASTTNGDFVRVRQEQRDGDLIIVSPSELRGERVALVSTHGGYGGAALVTTDLRSVPARAREGSGGDRPHE